MVRSLNEKLNSRRRSQRSRLSNDGTQTGSMERDSVLQAKGPTLDLANDAASEVSIDETLSHLSRQASQGLSDIDVGSFQSPKSEAQSPPTSRNSILIDRERTINTLQYVIEELKHAISSLESEKEALRTENESLRQALEKQQDSKQELSKEASGQQNGKAHNAQTLGLPSDDHSEDKDTSLSVLCQTPQIEQTKRRKHETEAEILKGSWTPQILGLAWIGTTAALSAYIFHLKTRR